MSLNFDLTRIPNWQQVSLTEENGIEGRKTEALIFATLVIDLPGITAKNVDEFVFRFETWEKLHGSLSSCELTREDIVRRIGLSTNVSALPRAKWMKKTTRNLR